MLHIGVTLSQKYYEDYIELLENVCMDVNVYFKLCMCEFMSVWHSKKTKS